MENVVDDRDAVLVRQIASRVGTLSLELTDVAGIIKDISTHLNHETGSLLSLDGAAREMAGGSGQILSATDVARKAGQYARQQMAGSRGRLDQAVQAIHSLIESTERITAVALGLDQALREVGRATDKISAISRQTHLLALNAAIEASRAGSAGAGFTVVANEVKALSRQTETATSEISATVTELSARLKDLTGYSREGSGRADMARQSTGSIVEVYEVVEQSIFSMGAATDEISASATQISEHCDAVVQRISALSEGVRRSDGNLKEASGRTDQMLLLSEELIALIGSVSVETEDTPIVRKAQEASRAVGTAFEQALDRREIAIDTLFSEEYRQISGSNPPQYVTPNLALAERVGAELMEAVTAEDKRIVATGLFDRNGYLAATTRALAPPPREDAEWNARHCRNKRIYTDRTAARACGSQAPFLLQTYRRNANGIHQVLKEASAPIMVRGRHWGAVRIMYQAGKD